MSNSYWRVVRIPLLIALVLSLPSLTVGFFSDDLMDVAALEHRLPYSIHPLDLYRFAHGDPVEMYRHIARGPLPWWTLPTLRIGFFRPLASALIVLDHSLFGHAPLGYHIHSILWFLALIASAGALLVQLFPLRTARTALLFFAMCPVHAMPVGWIANRHPVVALAFALAGLAAHVRARETQWYAGRWLAPLGLAVGLCASETALGVLAWLFAYECFAAPGTRISRVRALLPSLSVLLVYAIVHHELGYGAHGSALYLDPRVDPRAWLVTASVRMVPLLADLVAVIPADVWDPMPASRPLTVAMLVASLLGIAFALRSAWDSLAPETRRALAWIVPAGVLSIAPVSSTIPGARLLTLPALASSVLLGTLVLDAWDVRRERVRRAGSWAVLGTYGFAYGVLPVVLLPAGIMLVRHFASETTRIAHTSELRDHACTVVVSAADPMASLYAAARVTFDDTIRPTGWRVLSMAPRDVRATRTASDTILLETVDGVFLASPFEVLFRAPEYALSAGARVRLDGMTVAITKSDRAGNPLAIAFTFDRVLEDPALDFVVWDGTRLVHFDLPPVGRSTLVPHRVGPLGI